ncbi:MAG: hypothetical protein Q8O61_12100 [Nocardioides sp.]|nr:hypothetical protein [Nocardioides sp.]
MTATAVMGGLLLALLVTGGWLVLLGPATGDIGETRDAVASTEDRNQVLATELTALQAQAADLSGTRSVAGRLDHLFPPTADQPGLFQALVRAARAAGYGADELTSLSPTAPIPLIDGEPMGVAAGTGQVLDPTTADLAVQTVTLSAEGDYDQARALLGSLESLDRAFLVQAVELISGQVPGQLTLTVTGSTFLAPPVPAPAG